MSASAFKDMNMPPDDRSLEETLGESFGAYLKLREELSGIGAALSWNYYRDGAAWLCKMPYGKKNLGWLTACDRYFTLTCHFTRKHADAVERSSISETLKKKFRDTETSGRLIPVSVDMRTKELPDDVLSLLRLKMSLK